jgi:hypothetical protein
MISLYNQISNLARSNELNPNEVLEPLSVIQDVEAHRQFWRPETLRVILLAESHVFTAENANLAMDPPNKVLASLPESIPNKFVRFVYCIGYGEPDFVCANPPIKPNVGTWQFWKLFQVCGMGFGENAGVLVKDEKNSFKRIQNKVRLLSRLKEMGVWLLDASCFGLAPQNSFTQDKKTCSKIIRTCWQNATDGETDCCISKAMEMANGSTKVMIIGKGVNRIIGPEVRAKFGESNVELIPQPQSRDFSVEHLKILSDFCKGLRDNLQP